MKKAPYIISLLLFLSFGQGCDNNEPDQFLDIEHEIIREMQSNGINSLVTGIVNDDRIIWEGSFGFNDIARSKPTNRQTIYTLMSISKLFIAISVMQLWENNQIDLNADINDYLPFYVRNPYYPESKITPLMLLTHTSGLAHPDDDEGIPDFNHFFPHDQVPDIISWLPEYILPQGQYYRTAVWKNYPPGSLELYSNIATSLLALIVEQISQEDYRDYCRNNILVPLEMFKSGFRLNYTDESILATPYYDSGHPMQQYTYRHYPAGNLKSNLEDFSHFMIAMLNDGEFNGKQILLKSTIEKMLEIQNPATGMSLLWSHFLGNSVGHRGGGTGFSTMAEWLFDDDIAIFIASNKVNKSVYPGGKIYELVRYQAMLL